MDFSKDALDLCKKREIKRLIRGDLNQLGLKNEAFDFVFLIDVLYHQRIKDDIKSLEVISQALKPGGKLLITDCAFPFLISSHEQAVKTTERYIICSITQKLKQADFKVLIANFMFTTTFSLLMFVRLIQKNKPPKKSSSNMFRILNLINHFILKIMSIEARVLSRSHLPFCSSVIVLAEK